MTQSPEQFQTSAKAAAADMYNVVATVLTGFEKLVELNMSTAKNALADAAEQMQTLSVAKAPQDLTAATAFAQALAEKATAYFRAVTDIMTETGTALSKAGEGKFAGMQAQALAGIEAAMKHAPAGSESAVAAFKNAMTMGQSALGTAQGHAKQAVAEAGKNFAAATNIAVKSTKTAVTAE